MSLPPKPVWDCVTPVQQSGPSAAAAAAPGFLGNKEHGRYLWCDTSTAPSNKTEVEKTIGRTRWRLPLFPVSNPPGNKGVQLLMQQNYCLGANSWQERNSKQQKQQFRWGNNLEQHFYCTWTNLSLGNKKTKRNYFKQEFNPSLSSAHGEFSN